LSEVVLKSNKDQDLNEYLIIIARNAERLHRLTNNILDVTKIEGKILKLDKEMVNLDSLISSLVTEYQTSIERKSFGEGGKNVNDSTSNNDNNKKVRDLFCQVRYRAPLEPGLFLIEVDKDRIIQVLSNLLNNALNSSNQRMIQDNKIVLPIEVSMEKDENTSEEIVIMVKDRGIGIDRSINKKLFTKFVTTSDGGTGLGLYVSKSLVEAHGGKIWAFNNDNEQGATFCFTLPLKSMS